MGAPSATRASVVVAELHGTVAQRRGLATVVTEVVAIAPGDDSLLHEWETALYPVEPVPVDDTLAATAGFTFGAAVLARGLLAFVAALGTAAFRIVSSRL